MEDQKIRHRFPGKLAKKRNEADDEQLHPHFNQEEKLRLGVLDSKAASERVGEDVPLIRTSSVIYSEIVSDEEFAGSDKELDDANFHQEERQRLASMPASESGGEDAPLLVGRSSTYDSDVVRLQSLVIVQEKGDKIPNCAIIPTEITSKNSSVRKIYKYTGLAELPASFIRFGPVYYGANDALGMVEEAWKHLLDKSPNDQKTEDVYLHAFGRKEEETRACYADATLGGLSESDFQWMMIKDGCFFLQLVLFILGASKELGYPNDHITFGKKQGKHGRKVVHGWIESMFHVGNQIPLLVLNEFMKQDFFQDVVKKHGKWERPTDLLSKKLLYDLLVLPAILYADDINNGHGSVIVSEEQPSDLLHGLQNFVLGPEISRNDSDKGEDDDEEEEEGRDPEARATPNTNQGNAGNDTEELCVSGLRRKGICFWKLNNGAGVRGIQFKNGKLFPGLYLPTILLNKETELLFRNLKYYEMCQQERQQEVRSFLGLMSKLISTPEDIKHLSSKGILEICKSQNDYGEKFMRMLQNLSETVTDRNHRHILQQLRDYTSIFGCLNFEKIAMIMLILTSAQTVFSILGYFHN